MPTISPQIRATIGGSPNDSLPSPRKTMRVATGMNMPFAKESPQVAQEGSPASIEQKTGHSDIQEETTAGVVTLSPQLTALARKQQKLQSEIQAQREREAAFTAKEADYVPKSSFKEKLRTNVADALKDLGTDYEEIANLYLAQVQGEDPVQSLRSEFEQLKKSQEENTHKQYEATLKQYRSETDSLISSNPKAFHFVTKEKQQDAVVQHILETWQENPDMVLTVSQAAKEVEEVLREDARAKAALLKELDPPEVPKEETKAKTLPPPQRSAPRTLTEQVATTPTRSYGQFQHLSAKERLAQAIARAQK